MMKMTELNNHICLSVSQLTEETEHWIQLAGWIEIRLDLLNKTDLRRLMPFLSGKKVIITCRTGKHSETERFQFFLDAIQAGCKLIDLDIQTDQELYAQLQDSIHVNSVEILASYHNFQQTPTQEELRAILKKMQLFRPTYEKIACHVRNSDDLNRLKTLYPRENLIAFGMGEAGKSSRIDCLHWGSPFSYVYPDDTQPTAPGQLSYNQFIKLAKNGF